MPAAYVDTVATQLPPGSVESVEGSQRVGPLRPAGLDLGRRAGDAGRRSSTRRPRPTRRPRDLPVLAPALAFKWNYVTAGDMSQYADNANAHMYPGGYKPSNEISQITTAIRGVVPTKPLVTTEAGYHNALNTTNGHRPVPEDVAGVYRPRLLLEHYLRGEKRVYSYELIDEFDDPGLTNPEAHFGLLRRDWTPEAGVHRDEEPDRAARPTRARRSHPRRCRSRSPATRATGSTSSPRSATASTCCCCGATSRSTTRSRRPRSPSRRRT